MKKLIITAWMVSALVAGHGVQAEELTPCDEFHRVYKTVARVLGVKQAAPPCPARVITSQDAIQAAALEAQKAWSRENPNPDGSLSEKEQPATQQGPKK